MTQPNREGEVLVPFISPGRVPMLREARSTLIVSAIQALRGRGMYDAYERELPVVAREKVVSLIAGQWIPGDLSVAHYRAVDALRLSSETIEAIGAEVAERTSKTLLHTAVKMSKALGATPWAALGLAHRIREASWHGTDLCVWRLGPKEARYVWVGQPCAGVPYFVRSFCGFMRGLIGLFCTAAYVHPIPARCGPTTVSVRVSWA